MLAQEQGIAYGQAVALSAAPSMHIRPTPLNINSWVKDVGRRGLVMAKLALRNDDISQDIVQDSLLAFISRYADKPAEQWTPLFYRILHSQIMDYKRQQARRGKWLTWLVVTPKTMKMKMKIPLTRLPLPPTKIPQHY